MEVKKIIYFIRHGETNYTVKKISQGQIDISLNEIGKNQARKLAKTLNNIKIDKIISSPLKRAEETAKILNKVLKTELIIDKRLIEQYLGQREGQVFNTWTTEKQNQFRLHPEEFGGESNEAFYERVKEFCKTYEDCNYNILIVSHGGVFKNIFRYFNNITDFTTKFATPETCELVIIKE